MATDEFLLRHELQTNHQSSTLRFYRFSEPTLTIGYGLWHSVASSMSRQVPMVRRMTGGGIVLHEISDLTYSLIVPIAENQLLRKVKDSYFLIHEQLSQSLNDFQIKTELFDKNCCRPGVASSEYGKDRSSFCFESPVLHDVMLSGKKVAGAAQKRTQGYLLHQGSIAWNLLLEVCPHLSESAFLMRFAHGIGDLLHLPVKEVQLPVEELKSAVAVL